MKFSEWLENMLYENKEEYGSDNFLAESFNRVVEKSALLPESQFGKPRIKLTGKIINDLNSISIVDTYYLDELYPKLIKTGLYRNNNEVLRKLYGTTREIKEHYDGNDAMTKVQIDKRMQFVEDIFEQAGAAFDALDYDSLALFYGGACSTLAMAVKEFALKNWSS